MGQKRITVVDLSADSDEQTKTISAKSAKKRGAKIVRSGKGGTGRIADKAEPIESVATAPIPAAVEKTITPTTATKIKVKTARLRGQRYQQARRQVDRTTEYPLAKAIEMVKKTNIARFNATVTADLNLKEDKVSVNINFPYSTGKKTTVAIADDDLIKQIDQGKLNFDILLATPKMMPKLVKYAKILGPKGLLPNPKNGTINDDPQTKKKELESGSIQVKSQPKYPLTHVAIGKTKQKDQELISNVQALVKAINPAKIAKLTLATTMSPGIKVDLSSL